MDLPKLRMKSGEGLGLGTLLENVPMVEMVTVHI